MVRNLAILWGFKYTSSSFPSIRQLSFLGLSQRFVLDFWRCKKFVTQSHGNSGTLSFQWCERYMVHVRTCTSFLVEIRDCGWLWNDGHRIYLSVTTQGKMHQRWSTVNAVWFVVKNVSTRQHPGGLVVCKAVGASKQNRCFFQTEARGQVVQRSVHLDLQCQQEILILNANPKNFWNFPNKDLLKVFEGSQGEQMIQVDDSSLALLCFMCFMCRGLLI